MVALVIVLAASGRLRRNPFAGIRIPSLTASDDAWVSGHRTAVPPTTGGAVVCIVLAAIVLADPGLALLGAVLETAVLVLGVLVGAVRADRAARRHGSA